MATENDDQLVERLVPKILSSIRAKAKPVESIDIKDDLEGITSLPAYDTSNGIFKQVLVPVNALKEPARSAGETAEDAARKAYLAAEEAQKAAEDANEATEAANAYANRVKDVTEEEWAELEENQSWEEGVEYNVYSDEV